MTITDKQVEAALASWMGDKTASEAALSLIVPGLRAALEAAEAARERDTPVAWVEVTNAHEGPYEFHGIELLPEGRHELFLAEQSTLREVTPAAPSSAEQQTPFQARVQPWMQACFTPEICRDRHERNHRFLEEALELVQANGCTQSEAHQLVDYVYGRPVGELAQEVGGVMVTLAALCLASDVAMHAAGETELTRIWTKIDVIRAKQASKPPHSPLPTAPGAPEADERARFEARFETARPRVSLLRDRGMYRDERADAAWWAWQSSKVPPSPALVALTADLAACERALHRRTDERNKFAEELAAARAQSSAAPSVAPVSARDGEAVAILDKVCDLLQIGTLVRGESTILANVRNAVRRSNILSLIEGEFPGPAIEDDAEEGCGGDPWRDSLLNWGDDPEQYIAKFRAALASRVTPPADARDGEDARRYRWLRDVADSGVIGAPYVVFRKGESGHVRFALNDAELDAAIDRAMGGE